MVATRLVRQADIEICSISALLRHSPLLADPSRYIVDLSMRDVAKG
jgi:hypothetical protein